MMSCKPTNVLKKASLDTTLPRLFMDITFVPVLHLNSFVAHFYEKKNNIIKNKK